MSQVEPACRFCQGKLIMLTTFRNDPNTENLYSYLCQRCNSEQVYTFSGSPQKYSFKIGRAYELRFLPGEAKPFKVYLITDRVHLDGQSFRGKPVLEMDFIPHNLTPQNTTEARIKTLILFS